MTWRVSPSKCATRRASLRPRNRRLPANCGARWMAWTKTISAPACNAARISCAAASSPIRPKPPSPAICKSWGSRSATRLAPWAALSTLPKTPRSTAPWTIYRVCATNSRASADVLSQTGPGQPGGQQFQPGQLNRDGQSGQAGQRQQPVSQATGQQAVKLVKPAEARRVRSAIASPVRWAIRPVARAIAMATCMAVTTPAILASPAGPWRRNKVPTRPIPSARSTRD